MPRLTHVLGMLQRPPTPCIGRASHAVCAEAARCAGKRALDALEAPTLARHLMLDSDAQADAVLGMLRSEGFSLETCQQAVVRPACCSCWGRGRSFHGAPLGGP